MDFNSVVISSCFFLLPSFVIVRTGSACTYLYAMICVKPLRTCRSKCDPLLGLELPKTGGASSNESLFQRAIACRVFPAGRTARRRGLMKFMVTNYELPITQIVTGNSRYPNLILTCHAAQSFHRTLFRVVDFFHAVAEGSLGHANIFDQTLKATRFHRGCL